MSPFLIHLDMSREESRVSCLFCGREFPEQGDLFDHFGRSHLPDVRRV